MYTRNSLHINLCNVGCFVSHPDCNKMCILCNLVHHYHDGIILPYCLGKLVDEIYYNYLPFPFTNGKMVVTILLHVCAQYLSYNTQCIWLCNQQHLSSFQARNTSLLQLQLSSSTMDVQHMAHCASLSTPNFSIPEN
jgi:hypothetical protein